MDVRQMTFEGTAIGNLSSELVYMQREDDAHAIEARLMLDDEEFGLLEGTYLGSNQKNNLDATLTLTHLPLSLINGFVPDKIIGLEGFAEGELEVKGNADSPKINGELKVENAYLISKPYGIR